MCRTHCARTTTAAGNANELRPELTRQKAWDVRAALNNTSDKTYYASATGAAQIQFGNPRSLVVTGTYSF